MYWTNMATKSKAFITVTSSSAAMPIMCYTPLMHTVPASVGNQLTLYRLAWWQNGYCYVRFAKNGQAWKMSIKRSFSVSCIGSVNCCTQNCNVRNTISHALLLTCGIRHILVQFRFLKLASLTVLWFGLGTFLGTGFGPCIVFLQDV